jgi:diguanylate cyclase
MTSTWLSGSHSPLAWTPSFAVGLSLAGALAAVALLAYVFGRRSGKTTAPRSSNERQRELERAAGIALRLETIAGTLRDDLESHHGRLAQFRRRLADAQRADDDDAWKQLCGEAEQMLSPTMQLAEQLSMAYDAIRQQSEALETFTQARIDPHTGVGNGRALDEKFDVLLAATRRGGAEFSIALVSIDRAAGDPAMEDRTWHDAQVAAMAQLIRACMRDNDFVARYGDDEFVVVMPQTKLAGACVFGERLRAAAVSQMAITISSGLTQYRDADDAKTMLARADSAFYSARAGGGNRQFVHTGTQIREHRPSPAKLNESPLPATVLPPIPTAAAAPEYELATSGTGGR